MVKANVVLITNTIITTYQTFSEGNFYFNKDKSTEDNFVVAEMLDVVKMHNTIAT